MTSKTAHELAEAFGYLTAKEVTALKTLAEMLPPDPVVLNIGAGAGTSGLAFLETRDDLTLFTVDIRQDSPLGSLQSEMNAIEGAELDVKDRHYQYLGDSKKVCKTLPKKAFHMAFIDGDHNEKGIRADIEVVKPLLVEDAIVVFDDYGSSPKGIHRWPDVQKVVDEVMFDYELILHEDSVIAFRITAND